VQICDLLCHAKSCKWVASTTSGRQWPGGNMQSIPSDKFEIVLTLGCVYLALIVTFVLHLPTENPGSGLGVRDVFAGMAHVSICELNDCECTEGFFRRGPCLRIPLGRAYYPCGRTCWVHPLLQWFRKKIIIRDNTRQLQAIPWRIFLLMWVAPVFASGDFVGRNVS
jgi:hypothetical protein